MKENIVDEEFRLLQVFLNDTQVPFPSIYEVSVSKSKKVKCNCPVYSSRSKCKHASYVAEEIKKHGYYIPTLSEEVTIEDISDLNDSPEAHRDFILKFGIPEVM